MSGTHGHASPQPQAPGVRLVGETEKRPISDERTSMTLRGINSVNDIRTAIRELTARAALARKEGRPGDAAEIEQRIARYRDELAGRP